MQSSTKSIRRLFLQAALIGLIGCWLVIAGGSLEAQRLQSYENYLFKDQAAGLSFRLRGDWIFVPGGLTEASRHFQLQTVKAGEKKNSDLPARVLAVPDSASFFLGREQNQGFALYAFLTNKDIRSKSDLKNAFDKPVDTGFEIRRFAKQELVDQFAWEAEAESWALGSNKDAPLVVEKKFKHYFWVYPLQDNLRFVIYAFSLEAFDKEAQKKITLDAPNLLLSTLSVRQIPQFAPEMAKWIEWQEGASPITFTYPFPTWKIAKSSDFPQYLRTEIGPDKPEAPDKLEFKPLLTLDDSYGLHKNLAFYAWPGTIQDVATQLQKQKKGMRKTNEDWLKNLAARMKDGRRTILYSATTKKFKEEDQLASGGTFEPKISIKRYYFLQQVGAGVVAVHWQTEGEPLPSGRAMLSRFLGSLRPAVKGPAAVKFGSQPIRLKVQGQELAFVMPTSGWTTKKTDDESQTVLANEDLNMELIVSLERTSSDQNLNFVSTVSVIYWRGLDYKLVDVKTPGSAYDNRLLSFQGEETEKRQHLVLVKHKELVFRFLLRPVGADKPSDEPDKPDGQLSEKERDRRTKAELKMLSELLATLQL